MGDFHHSNAGECVLCAEKLKGVHPDLATWFLDLKHRFPDAHISWGFRNKADQERMVAEGKSKAHFGQSKHNYTKDGKPCSEALDLFALDDNGAACFPYWYYEAIWLDIKKNDELIEWAWNWKSFKEADHFQLPG